MITQTEKENAEADRWILWDSNFIEIEQLYERAYYRAYVARSNRVKRKEKITWVDAGSLLSRLGWIWHSDTYAYYERYIKPYVKVKVLKTLVSKARKKGE